MPPAETLLPLTPRAAARIRNVGTWSILERADALPARARQALAEALTVEAEVSRDHRALAEAMEEADGKKRAGLLDAALETIKVPFYREDPASGGWRFPATQTEPVAGVLRAHGYAVQADPALPLVYLDARLNALRAWMTETGRPPTPHQEDLLRKVREKASGLIVQAPMGAGKTLLVSLLVEGLAWLRPAVVAGAGVQDCRQLYQHFEAFFKARPGLAQPLHLWHAQTPAGRRRREKGAVEATGQGIVILTKSNFHNLPANVRLLVIDECHASATPHKVGGLIDGTPEAVAVFGLTATHNLRADKGERLLTRIIGPKLVVKTHRQFEAEGRVNPTHVHLWTFHPDLSPGSHRYAHNPNRPGAEPGGRDETHALVENHRGRARFIADLARWLPPEETKLIFVRHAVHGARILAALHEHPELAALMPVLIHADHHRADALALSKEQKDRYVEALQAGHLRLAVATGTLGTGFDCSRIQHVIDATGEKALITSLQASGRAARVAPRKGVSQVHLVADFTRELRAKKAAEKAVAFLKYYGYRGRADQPLAHDPAQAPPWRRASGFSFHPAPPWLTPPGQPPASRSFRALTAATVFGLVKPLAARLNPPKLNAPAAQPAETWDPAECA